MPSEGDLMRSALKKAVLPELERFGFDGKGLHFQRRGESLDLLDFQYWKHGGEFILEVGRCSRGDLHTSWGEIVPEVSITVAHLSPLERARLEQRGPNTGQHGTVSSHLSSALLSVS